MASKSQRDFVEVLQELSVNAEHALQLDRLVEELREHDSATVYHCLRVATLAYEVGVELNLSPAALFYAGLLHDFGKLSVPRKVLAKSGIAFSSDDFQLVKGHPLYGYQFLKDRYPFSAEILLRHHYFQRNRYPDPLPMLDTKYSAAETMLIERCAQILALVDFYDAFRTRGQRSQTDSTVFEALMEEYPEERATIECLFACSLFEE
ncbi:MAG: HD domain-containing protein [Candidatus Spechtbacteria bacterium]|nr:HD domain-containing protein [Candidatus Spechtbacteria bacterium]